MAITLVVVVVVIIIASSTTSVICARARLRVCISLSLSLSLARLGGYMTYKAAWQEEEEEEEEEGLVYYIFTRIERAREGQKKKRIEKKRKRDALVLLGTQIASLLFEKRRSRPSVRWTMHSPRAASRPMPRFALEHSLESSRGLTIKAMRLGSPARPLKNQRTRTTVPPAAAAAAAAA